MSFRVKYYDELTRSIILCPEHGLIETVEATPDTIITTVDGRKYVCKESVDEVIRKVIEFEGSIRLYADAQKIEGA